MSYLFSALIGEHTDAAYNSDFLGYTAATTIIQTTDICRFYCMSGTLRIRGRRSESDSKLSSLYE